MTRIIKKEEKKDLSKLSKKQNNINNDSIKTIIKRIFAVSIPISLSSLLSSVNKNIDSFTVVRILKPILRRKCC